MYAVQLFVRAKPVVFVIDDAIVMITELDSHRFALVSPYSNAFWPLVMEKAFAKMKGNYLNLNMGYLSNVFKAILGVPSEVKNLKDFNSDGDIWN